MTEFGKFLSKKLTAGVLASAMMMTAVPFLPLGATAATSNPVVVVSLGDSYSSGEGIEPFYGQNKELSQKVRDEDWLAHRSTKAWPSLLEFSGVSGKTKDYNVKTSNSSVCKWYFGAVSGAETKHFKREKLAKYYKKDKPGWFTGDYEGTVMMPKQLDVFNNIKKGDVDYVTLTVGGNDVGFVDIITTCATSSTYLHFGSSKSKLEKQMDGLWAQFATTEANIKQVYKDIQSAAGSQANIIVAGYPKLLDKKGKSIVISAQEAAIVNDNVSKFNDKIESIVNSCRKEGMNIHFVDVEAEFDKNGGHQAYSSNAWINKIQLFSNSEDLEDIAICSAYSMHPNEEGAKAYARCVNAKIKEIENSKSTGKLSGKISSASNRAYALGGASINVYSDEQLVSTAQTDSDGNYALDLPAGEYKVVASASGYVDFTSYADVAEDDITYMETFPLVQGDADETGMAQGNVCDALTGENVNDVELIIKDGWNNSETGDDVYTTFTGSEANSSDGSYAASLPIGNYTVCASKDGYVSSPFNIIVQNGTTEEQNVVISPVDSDDSYRIVLTWDNDSDLDSHLEGAYSDGSWFHAYYYNTSVYDDSVEICTLDIDDANEYNTETVTLSPYTDAPYYYYIHKYSGSGTLASSGAKISIYQGTTLIKTLNVPTNLGDSSYWNAFAVKNGQLIIENTITDYADIDYAG